ncbi:MAG TPA: type II toxin-antitoxin system prevent-host-death family antitoxin [Thermomicrobiales bacterium]|nr:type II toxin-antitoxin system prevent-host-death family antitoxin [Thermomicrobiales bacterium]
MMDETISAAEANRSFSRILRGVRDGQSYLITSHGHPVARIVPTDENEALAGRAKAELIARALEREVLNIPITWSRDDLYEDEA